MKRIFLTCVGMLALASPALAADLPPPPSEPSYYKAPPPPAPSWTGCYINGGGGAGLTTRNQGGETFPGLVATTRAIDVGGQGWLGVAGGGCDYQFHVWNWDLVFGAFGDYDFMNLRGTGDFAGVLGNIDETAAWAAGARLGVVVLPSVLLYSTAGYSGAHMNAIGFTTAGGVPTGTGTGPENLTGWFVGGGTETSLSWIMSGLFLRTEYRYSSYAPTNNPVIVTATGAPTGVAVRSNLASETIFTELVWRFNFSGMHW